MTGRHGPAGGEGSGGRHGSARRDFRKRVEAVVASLGVGEVVTYGEVAEEAGFPGAARGVGAVMAHPDEDSPAGLPWWRVVTAGGRLVPGAEADHGKRLRAEGVEVRDGRAVLGSRTPGRIRR